MAKKKTKIYIVKLKAGVIVRHRGRVLLIRERNNRTHHYRWNIIKGTFEPGRDASIIEAAIREAREETGAKIKPKHFLSAYYLLDNNKSLMMFTFIADLIGSKFGVLPRKLRSKYGADNIIETRLFTKEELAGLKPKDFVGMRGYLAVQDYLKGIKFPLDIVKTSPPK